MTSADIKKLFEPESIAVIGASSDHRKIGYKVLDNILSGGFKGKVYPINPNGGEVSGLTLYKDIMDVDGSIDVACLVIPAKYVFDAVKQCAKKKVQHLLIITSGFSEVGNIELEKEIVTFANENGMRVVGPNIFGLYSASYSLNATFGPKDIKKGKIAIITQSGALGIAIIGKTAVENLGLSAIVSVGNKSDIDETDLLEYLSADENTNVIVMYIEGIKHGDRLVKALKKTTKKKPVIVIKSGRSKRGAIAAASHTGSLAGSDEVFSHIMEQCGVLRAESLQEMFSWTKFLKELPLPSGNNTVIITNGGGIGVMATDACEKYKVKLYSDTEVLKKLFEKSTPDFGSTKNPIDLTGQASSTDYNNALAAALKSPDIHAVLALYCETAVFDVDNLTKMIKTNEIEYKKANKPICFSILGGEKTEKSLELLRHEGVPVFPDVYDAVSCLGAMYHFYHHLNFHSNITEEIHFDVGSVNNVVNKAISENRYFLLTHEAQTIMKTLEIPVPKSYIAKNLEEAVRFAQKISYPVVMKVASKDIIHKSDAGGVALNIENDNEVMDAFQAILHNCRTHYPDALIEGVEVSQMIELTTEMIVGARIDSAFGAIAMCGLGGIYVEVMKDVSFRALPLNRQELRSMLEEIKSYPLLLGVRGEKRKDIDSVIEVIMKLGSLIQQCHQITDIEINPLVVYEQGKGVIAVDVRILLSKDKRGA